MDYGTGAEDPLVTIRWNIHTAMAAILLAHDQDLTWDDAKELTMEDACKAENNGLKPPALAFSKGELMDVRKKRLELEAAEQQLQQQQLLQQQQQQLQQKQQQRQMQGQWLAREELERQHQLEAASSGDPMGSQRAMY